MTIPFKRYGRDFSGADCWGLVYLVAKHFGKTYPRFEEVSFENKSEVESVINAGRFSPQWDKVEVPEFLDVVVMTSVVKILGRLVRAPVHCGIMVDDKCVLHTGEKTGVLCQRLLHRDVKSRLVGVYRYTG